MPPFETWAPYVFGGGGLLTLVVAGLGKFFAFMQARSASTAITQKELIAGLESLHEKKEAFSASRIEDLEAQLRAEKEEEANLESQLDAYRVTIHRLFGELPESSESSAFTPESKTT